MKKPHETAELDMDSWLAQFIDGSTGRCVRSSGDSSSRPSFLVLNPKFGLIAIEVGAMSDSAEQTRVKLNLKVNALEKQLNKLSELPLIRISIIHKPKNFFEKINGAAFVVEKNQVNKIVWDKELSSKNLNESLLKKATETLWPEFSFAKPAYSGTRDKKKLKTQSK